MKPARTLTEYETPADRELNKTDRLVVVDTGTPPSIEYSYRIAADTASQEIVAEVEVMREAVGFFGEGLRVVKVTIGDAPVERLP